MKDKVDLESLILELLERRKTANLKEVAEAAGFPEKTPAQRRAIQRALSDLIERKLIGVQGKGPARSYFLLKKSVLKSIKPSHVIEYNPEFLFSYKPNESFYLPSSLRLKLLAVGQTENVTRPAGTYARHILNRLLIDLSWNSSRLEGNTYSLLETKRLIELGLSASGKDAKETQMILNHKEAIEYIVESANEPQISALEVRSIHALLSNNLLGDPNASGQLREIAVGIGGTPYRPLNNPHLLKECFNTFIEKINVIEDPFEQSFFSLVHLSYLQAFEDVNKRTARLTANIPLIRKNLKPLSFLDVNQYDYVNALLAVYEKNEVTLLRDLYEWAYHKSAQRYSAHQLSVGEADTFKLKYRSQIQEIIRTIILKKIPGNRLVEKIRGLIETLKLPEHDASRLFQIIEIEIISLHEGNIARFKIRLTEYQEWKLMS